MSRLSVYRRCKPVDMVHGARLESAYCAAALPFESTMARPPRRIFVGLAFLPSCSDNGSGCLCLLCGICFMTGTGFWSGNF